MKQRSSLLGWGEAAPHFEAPTPSNPQFKFSSLAGRYIVLAVLPSLDSDLTVPFLRDIQAAQLNTNDSHLALFAITRERAAWSHPEVLRAFPPKRVFLDETGGLLSAFGALTDAGVKPHWLLLDPDLRVWARGSLKQVDKLVRKVANLPQTELHSGQQRSAPILIVPRVLPDDLCAALVDEYHRVPINRSGYMIEQDGKTIGARDEQHKRRYDATIQDPQLIRSLQLSLQARLFDQLYKAYGFMPTRIERYIVACYTGEDRGFFSAHRDNTTAGTAHRRFAVTLNLTDDYDGGTLTFPEFGSQTYRAPKGGAVVFGCGLLHQANPVTRGARYATLPFLYDEAGMEIRRKNLHLLADTDGALEKAEHAQSRPASS